ncbi:DUF3426 domain-containing protein [Massilia horti]|uniref:DUF3426 domain-containing protein n=1 Tax=Massilia horti TaxID=2562153 RepID=A0A4Y9T3R8_9BURK|nr:DUF3426 domain-containing protein [Massilia horti]TFW34029.1 DUF3426 domain-containing protein [Massilia horti]
MALATRCPHCGKRFRVAADQLKLRGGIVRCGACHEIFDGNATLIDLDALAAGKPPAATITAPVPAEPARPASSDNSESVAASVWRRVPAQAETSHEDPPEAKPEEAQQPSPDDEQPQAPAPANEPGADGHTIYTLHLDHTLDPLGILPDTEPDEEEKTEAQLDAEPAIEEEADAEAAPQAEPTPVPEPHAAPALEQGAVPESEPADPPRAQPAPALATPAVAESGRIEPTLGLPVDEELVAVPLPDDDHELDAPSRHAAPQAQSGPLPLRESAPSEPPIAYVRPARPRVADSKPGRRSKLTPTKIAQPRLRVPESDEPEFVRRSRQQEKSGKIRRIVMAAGSVILLLVLAVQAMTTYRNVLAARYPDAKPALAAICHALGCRVELPTQIDNLSIEQGELVNLGNNAYSLTTLLHNQGSLVQAWPHIELTLTDTNDKPLLRRVFAPAQYLPQGFAPAAGFAARGEQPVKLSFQLDQLKPSGYRIAIFYP